MAITQNLNTFRQASGRHWRIGQVKACKTVCLFYSGTAQEKAVRMMANKLVAARQLEGKMKLAGLACHAEVNKSEIEMLDLLMESMSGD